MVQIQAVCSEIILIELCQVDFFHWCYPVVWARFVETCQFSNSVPFLFIVNLSDNAQVIYT